MLAEPALRMEQRGLALSWSALRFAYSMGGDGESDIKIDLRNVVAYARDRVAVVTCIMLPFYCSLHINMQVRFSTPWHRVASWEKSK